jgi:hypothetical protein
MEAEIEGREATVGHNGILRVGSAVVSRLFSSSFPFSANIPDVKKIYFHWLPVFNLTYQLSTEKSSTDMHPSDSSRLHLMPAPEF